MVITYGPLVPEKLLLRDEGLAGKLCHVRRNRPSSIGYEVVSDLPYGFWTAFGNSAFWYVLFLRPPA